LNCFCASLAALRTSLTIVAVVLLVRARNCSPSSTSVSMILLPCFCASDTAPRPASHTLREASLAAAVRVARLDLICLVTIVISSRPFIAWFAEMSSGVVSQSTRALLEQSHYARLARRACFSDAPREQSRPHGR